MYCVNRAPGDIMVISRSPIMVDILVRNIDGATAVQLKKKAKAEGKSVNDIAREALRAAVKPSKEEIWGEADRLRKKIGKVLSDSTADIREWRDNKKSYR
jgi:plasmid stability protein